MGRQLDRGLIPNPLLYQNFDLFNLKTFKKSIEVLRMKMQANFVENLVPLKLRLLKS